jgi:hypothetical protein
MLRYRLAVAMITMAAIVSVAALAPASQEARPSRSDPYPLSCDGHPVGYHVDRHRAITDHVYRHADYTDAHPAERSDKRAWGKHKFCIQDAGRREAVGKYRGRAAADYRRWSRRVEFQVTYTPFDCGSAGHFAVPCGIVSCESHYVATARNRSSTAGGYYQMLDSTWYANGGSHNGDSHPAAAAPPEEQHVVGHNLYASQGTSPWDASRGCWG